MPIALGLSVRRRELSTDFLIGPFYGNSVWPELFSAQSLLFKFISFSQHFSWPTTVASSYVPPAALSVSALSVSPDTVLFPCSFSDGMLVFYGQLPLPNSVSTQLRPISLSYFFCALILRPTLIYASSRPRSSAASPALTNTQSLWLFLLRPACGPLFHPSTPTKFSVFPPKQVWFSTPEHIFQYVCVPHQPVLILFAAPVCAWLEPVRYPFYFKRLWHFFSFLRDRSVSVFWQAEDVQALGRSVRKDS